MTKDELRILAEAAYGKQWQSKLSADFNTPLSTIKRWAREGVPKQATAQGVREHLLVTAKSGAVNVGTLDALVSALELTGKAHAMIKSALASYASGEGAGVEAHSAQGVDVKAIIAAATKTEEQKLDEKILATWRSIIEGLDERPYGEEEEPRWVVEERFASANRRGAECLQLFGNQEGAWDIVTAAKHLAQALGIEPTAALRRIPEAEPGRVTTHLGSFTVTGFSDRLEIKKRAD
jgi:1-aminocyclopropane-1-carboxylate deaminase/D-cysteine desulfhydrase-like pyridoxal-dependent ACC family enzyme